MNYSILFFELTLALDTKAFRRQLDRAYKNADKMDCRIYPVGFDHVDESHLSNGIGIRYYDNKHKKIRFVIYPGLVIGDNDLSELWKPNSDNISRLREGLVSFVSGYFNSDYELNDFKLTRVDYAVDINVGSRERVYDYMKLLKGIRRVKLFSPIKDPKHDGTSFFGLKGRTNGVEFRAYDLKYDKKIRVEVRLLTKGVIRAYCDESDTSKQIKAMSKNSKHILMDTIQYVIPRGDHYKLKRTQELVTANVDDKTLRNKMIRILELVARKKSSLWSAQKAVNVRNIIDIMDKFAEIGLSPITLGKRYKGKRIESLYNYMED